MYWMKARDIPKYEAHFQKVSLNLHPFLLLAIQNIICLVHSCLYF